MAGESSSAKFSYAEGIHGKFSDLKVNYSIAVDNSIIPKQSKGGIDGLEDRVAADTGGATILYHLDRFFRDRKGRENILVKSRNKWKKTERKVLGSIQMKKPTYICFALLIAVLNRRAEAETIKNIYLDKKNNVYIITAKGQHQKITNTSNARYLKLAPDNETAAWLVATTWIAEGDYKPGSNELIVYRNRKLASIKCGPFIRDYWFWMNGAQVAIDCGGRHFAGQEILYDTRTLEEIARIDEGKVPLAERPDWSNGDN